MKIFSYPPDISKIGKKILFLLLSPFLLFLSCSSETTKTEEHEHEHGGESLEAELTQAQMDAVGIRLGFMEKRNMADIISATGVLEVSPQAEAVVSAKLPGTVSRILVTPGQKVSAGQIVAYVDAPQLLSLRQEYLTARQEVEAAQKEYERQKALSAQGAGVKRNLDNAISTLSIAQVNEKSIAAQLRGYGVSPEGDLASAAYPVKADISGTVTEVGATIGAFADMQFPIARIVNNNAIYCSLQILEKDIRSIAPGMDVEMRLTNDPSLTFSGKVSEVNPVLDGASRTIPVRVTIDGDKSEVQLIPGMAVSAQISGGGEETDALPEGAIVSSGGKNYIFVLEDVHEEDGDKAYHFEKREVAVGLTSFGYTAVTPLEPLDKDAQIVVAGAFYLNSASSSHGEHSH